MRGTLGKRSCRIESCTYSGRKSCPHCDTQCASSMAKSAISMRSSNSRKRGVIKRSGATYSRSSSLASNRRSTRAAAIASRRRVQERRPHARLRERIDLILHQRDQRRDHDTGAGPQDCRDLIAQRLAAAGRHQHERVAAGDEVLDDGSLVAAKLLIAEDRTQDAQSRGGHGKAGAVMVWRLGSLYFWASLVLQSSLAHDPHR